MNAPARQSSGDENCPMCKRPKSRHTNDEMFVCSKKLEEFRKNPSGGAGIE